MGKLLLSVVLLILVVAVSYIQAVRRQAKVDNSFQLGQKSRQGEIINLQSAADSLRSWLGFQEVKYAESLLTRDQTLVKNSDSLTAIIKSQQQTISDLKKKNTTDSSVSQKPAEAEKRHRELLTYYKTRYDRLPADLTEYERKIAISEMRQETAAKYSITISEFNRIRDSYKVTY